MRSAIPMTRPMWCSTSSTVRSKSSREPRDERAELRDLLVVQTARRLVEQQEARPATSARASSTRFSVPNGSPATGRPASLVSPT